MDVVLQTQSQDLYGTDPLVSDIATFDPGFTGAIAEGVDKSCYSIACIGVEIYSAVKMPRVFIKEPSCSWVVVSGAVIA
jgi:hypothetical protein